MSFRDPSNSSAGIDADPSTGATSPTPSTPRSPLLNPRLHSYAEAAFTTAGGFALVVANAVDSAARLLGVVAVFVGAFATVTRLAWDWIDRREARSEKRARSRRKPEPEAESL